MFDDGDWLNEPANGKPVFNFGNGVLRGTMLFGVLAVALGLFVAPLLDRATNGTQSATLRANGIDYTTTASTPSTRTYTKRRSILQESPSSVCIITADGRYTGECGGL